MATRKAIAFNGMFNGLYEWGKGWVSNEVREKWDYWWENEFPEMWTTFWRYVGGEDGECGRLVGTGEAVYMHPMVTRGTFVSCGVTCGCYVGGEKYEYAFYEELAELERICVAVAEYCGGSFHMSTTKEFDIEVPDDMFSFGGRDEYAVVCGSPVLARDLQL